MKPSEFISFESQLPDKNKWIIVTNNLDAKNAHGEMSHVWLIINFIQSSDLNHNIVAYNEEHRKIIRLTHWKYA